MEHSYTEAWSQARQNGKTPKAVCATDGPSYRNGKLIPNPGISRWGSRVPAVPMTFQFPSRLGDGHYRHPHGWLPEVVRNPMAESGLPDLLGTLNSKGHSRPSTSSLFWRQYSIVGGVRLWFLRDGERNPHSASYQLCDLK